MVSVVSMGKEERAVVGWVLLSQVMSQLMSCDRSMDLKKNCNRRSAHYHN